MPRNHELARRQDIELFSAGQMQSHDGGQLTPMEQARLARDIMADRRREQGDRFAHMILCIGLCFVGSAVLLICLAIFASAVSPAPPPANVTKNSCLLFCGD